MDSREALGWYGVIALLAAYGLVSFSVVSSSGFSYHFLNLTGALGIIVVSLEKKNYQPVALNAAWGLIALASILRLVL